MIDLHINKAWIITYMCKYACTHMGVYIYMGQMTIPWSINGSHFHLEVHIMVGQISAHDMDDMYVHAAV